MTTATRPRHKMSSDVADALKAKNVRAAYDERPAYQRNDYLGWIFEAKQPDTRAKRIDQMVDELKRGDVYMKMAWNGATSD